MGDICPNPFVSNVPKAMLGSEVLIPKKFSRLEMDDLIFLAFSFATHLEIISLHYP